MVTEHRFASPQTNVTKQNKPGRTKRYDCIPLPTESATASNPTRTNPALETYDQHGELAMLAYLTQTHIDKEQHERWMNDGVLDTQEGGTLVHNQGEYRFTPDGSVTRPAMMKDVMRTKIKVMNDWPAIPVVLDETMPAPCRQWLNDSGLADDALKIRATGRLPRRVVEQLVDPSQLVDVMGIVMYQHFEGDHVLRPADAHAYLHQFAQLVNDMGLASPLQPARPRPLTDMHCEQFSSLLALCEAALDSDWKISTDVEIEFLLSKALELNDVLMLSIA